MGNARRFDSLCHDLLFPLSDYKGEFQWDKYLLETDSVYAPEEHFQVIKVNRSDGLTSIHSGGHHVGDAHQSILCRDENRSGGHDGSSSRVRSNHRSSRRQSRPCSLRRVERRFRAMGRLPIAEHLSHWLVRTRRLPARGAEARIDQDATQEVQQS
jgi:hypothetical protein